LLRRVIDAVAIATRYRRRKRDGAVCGDFSAIKPTDCAVKLLTTAARIEGRVLLHVLLYGRSTLLLMIGGHNPPGSEPPVSGKAGRNPRT